ncbi:MAG: GAF domain-containing protein [Casimicrobiaceae bacterium]
MTTQAELRKVLARDGLPGLVAALNADVPYRFTGVFVQDGGLLRNVALYDKTSPSPPLWAPFPVIESFCSLIFENGAPLVIGHAQGDARSEVREHAASATVQSYCGIPVFGADGEVIGTLCHFDFAPIKSQVDLEQLLQAPPLMAPYLTGQSQGQG